MLAGPAKKAERGRWLGSVRAAACVAICRACAHRSTLPGARRRARLRRRPVALCRAREADARAGSAFTRLVVAEDEAAPLSRRAAGLHVVARASRRSWGTRRAQTGS